MVSFHFGVHHVPEYITSYEEEAAHAVIDEGADLVLGHHAHILKGIEVYRGRVIFYGLGNFAMDPSRCRTRPMHWFYDAHHARGIVLRGFPWYFRNVLDPEIEGRLTNLDRCKTIIAKAVIRSRRIERVSFLPAIITLGHKSIILNHQDTQAQEVFEYVQRISRSQGLEADFIWDGDEVTVTSY